MLTKETITTVAKSMTAGIKKHSPEILTGMGIVGMGATVIFAVKATPKALKLIEEAKVEREVDELTPIETVKIAWKPYIPAAITGVTSVACVIGASSVNVRRNAALATAYTLSETAFREYKDKLVETVGEEKVKEVKEAIAQDKIEKDPVSNHRVYNTKCGDTLCYDSLSGQYFYSSVDAIRKAVNLLNERMLKYEYVSMNDWYYELELGNTKLGNELGWNITQGMVDITFSSRLSEDEIPCLVLDYDRMPAYDFDRWL